MDANAVKADTFYQGAYARLVRSMFVIAVMASASGTVRFGWRVGAGVAAGCALSGINFLWMKRAIQSFTIRLAEPRAEEEKVSRGSATRFLARYALVGAVAYVIFKSSVISLSGVLVGLFLPVAAILGEAVFETYMALRHGL